MVHLVPTTPLDCSFSHVLSPYERGGVHISRLQLDHRDPLQHAETGLRGYDQVSSRLAIILSFFEPMETTMNLTTSTSCYRGGWSRGYQQWMECCTASYLCICTGQDSGQSRVCNQHTDRVSSLASFGTTSHGS